jgi:N-acetylglutamate synthase
VLRRQDVGHRIVVRRIVGVREGRGLFSDALGELVELTETHLTLATAKGPLRMPLAEVHRAKRVPPTRRPTAHAVLALERAADEAWPAPVRDRMGDWLLRSAGGWTGRANSALPIGDPDRPLDAALDAVVDWYAQRGQPALVNVPLPLAAPVGSALHERGWGARPLTLVQTAPLAGLLAAPARPTGLPAVELTNTPSEQWLALAEAREAARSTSGRDTGAEPATEPTPATEPGPTPATEPGPGSLSAAARHVITAVDQVRFASVYDDPGPHGRRELLAIARGTVTGPDRWLGIALVEVMPDARRRGLARHMIRALAEWGAGVAAKKSFLQVEERNTCAVALYRRLGFTTHHTYLTRVLPGHR